MELVACEWGQSKTFMLPFIEYGATDFKTGATFEAGDVKVSQDGGAFGNIDTLPTVLGAWMVITLSAAEMQARYIALQIIDQTGTKVFEDQGAILTTDVKAWHQALFTLIESQRGSHTGVHDQFFWDPIGGNDSNTGLFWHDAKLTYTYNGAGGIHSLLANNEHQIVHLLPQAGGAPTTVNEYVEVDTAYTFLRGPGRDFLFEATHNESCAVMASAEGIEFSGFRAKTKVAGSQDAICTTGDFTRIHNTWVDYSRGNGYLIDNASSCIIDNFLVQDAAKGGSGHAVHILGDTSLTTRNIIGAGQIFSNGNGGDTDGVRVDGANCDHNFVTGGSTALLIHDNTGYGINEVNGADHTIVVGPTVNLAHNDLGDHNLTGAGSLILNHEQWATVNAEAHILQQTTIATLTSQTEFTLTEGSADNGAFDGASIIITDATTSVQKAVGTIFSYTGGTKGVILNSDPTIFTMAVGDKVQILLNTASTVLANAIISEKVDTLLDVNKPQKLTVDTTTRLEYQWLDSDGDPVDISALTFKFKAVKNAGEASPAIAEVTGTIQDGPNGRWYFDILPTTVFKGRYEIWAVDGASKITTLTMAGGARVETHPRL